MSQGSVGVAPIAIVFAAGAAVVVVAASAAVLVAYAANQAAEGTLRAVGRKGAALEAEAAAQCEADHQALRWQAAAADVVGLNARLRMAAEQAHRAGVAVDLPPPFVLANRSREEAVEWAARTEQRLSVARQALDAADVDARHRALMASLPTREVPESDTAAALADYQAALRASRIVVHRPRQPDVEDDMAAILHRLDPDATQREHDAALKAALLARTRRNALDADAYLDALRRLVDVEIKKSVANRRLAATWLQALELPAVTAADPRPPFDGTAARLLDVVRGTATLTDELEDEGRRAAAWAAGVTRQEFLRDRMRQRLADACYVIGEELQSPRGTRLTVTREDWDGEHSARVFLTSDGVITGRLARDEPDAGDHATARDQQRCGELHELLHGFAAETSGVRVTVEAGRPPLLTYTDADVEDQTRLKAKGRGLGARMRKR